MVPDAGKDFFAMALLPNDNIQVTIWLTSPCAILGCADIATSPHTPLPPFMIFCVRYVAAFASAWYFCATSINAGPIDLSASLWQLLQSIVWVSDFPLTNACPC